jgi:hypothetical protein
MRWDPSKGHVPRGNCGATGDLAEIELVLVTAEPGDPHPAERHDDGTDEASYLRSAYLYAHKCFVEGKDLFHRNVRLILNLCWPDLSLEQQMRRTMLLDPVLCSAKTEGGKVPREVEAECRGRYLEPMLRAVPRATVVALGGKAFSRLNGIVGVIKAHSVAPPGCNYKPARPSWEAAAEEVRRRAKQ